MKDVSVYYNACDEQGESGIDTVCPGDDQPSGAEGIEVLGAVLRYFGPAFSMADSASGLVSSDKLNNVGHKKMAGNKGVENKAEENVVATVVVTADADEDAILREPSAYSTEGLVQELLTF